MTPVQTLRPVVLATLATASFGLIVLAVNGQPAAASAAQRPAAAFAALPDPLALPGGGKVATEKEWSERRERMKAVLEENLTGHAPPAPGNLRTEVLKSQSVLDGQADYQLVRLTFGPNHSLHLDAALYRPAGAKLPLPTIVFIGFTGTPGDDAPADAGPKYQTVSAEAFARQRRDVLSDGYAILTFYYQQGAADHDHNRATGFFPAYPGFDWGTLAVWAWSASRCVDYLLTQPFVDPRQIILVGHSRLGKAALIAGAFDERFALVVPAGSGCGGTGAFRVNGKARGGKEGLEEASSRFPYWFSPRLRTYAGRVEQLPFDQNWLVALVAPRPLLDTEAFGDPYCNGQAAVATYRASQPVYAWLQADDRLGLHYREGGHALTDDDWAAILDFSDHQLRGSPARLDFHTVPDGSRLH